MRAQFLFWPFSGALFVSIALFLAGPFPDGFFSVDHAGQRFVFLIVMGCGLTISGAVGLLLKGGPATAQVCTVWLALFAGVVLSYTHRQELSDLYDQMRGNIQPSVALTTAQGEAELRRAWDGHYRAEADVNGVTMKLMVDTGATMVLIPYEVAGELGLDPEQLDFITPVTTANGSSTVAPVRISSIKIGPIAVFDVKAAVARPGMLKVGLLGMSFLDKLEETSFRGDRLFMRN